MPPFCVSGGPVERVRSRAGEQGGSRAGARRKGAVGAVLGEVRVIVCGARKKVE